MERRRERGSCRPCRPRTLACALLFLAGPASAGGENDLVALKDGKELRGRVVYQDARSLVLRRGARDTELAAQDIERVESVVHHLDALLDNAAECQGDMDGLEVLAEQARECGLDGEARVFWWRMLRLDPRHEGAHRSLGHRRKGSSWTVPLGGRSVEYGTRLELARDWGSAWELSSLHYGLRSNLPLETCLTVVLDLERLYQGFYQLFGAELRLFEICRPMNVALHADAASYPDRGQEFGYYDPLTDTIHIDASRQFSWETLAHEATHQLLQNTAFPGGRSSGELPPWLNEGLAEYVAAGVESASGKLVFDPGRPRQRHFRTHGRCKDPLDLTRVLNLSVGDYQASSDRELKYSQSYTLVHFLLHGLEQRYRPGFFAFLRGVYRGQGSSTDLRKCLDVDWRKLEPVWNTYARNLGGG